MFKAVCLYFWMQLKLYSHLKKVSIDKANVFVSGLTIRNDRLNDKRKNMNSLLKRKCDEENICFVNNTNINVDMLNNSALY